MGHFQVQKAPPVAIAPIKAGGQWPPNLLVKRRLTICLPYHLSFGKIFLQVFDARSRLVHTCHWVSANENRGMCLVDASLHALTTYPEKAYSEYAANKHFTFCTKNTKEYQALWLPTWRTKLCVVGKPTTKSTHCSHWCALATSTKVSSDFTTSLMHPRVTSLLLLNENLTDTFGKKKCKKHTVQENVTLIFTET